MDSALLRIEAWTVVPAALATGGDGTGSGLRVTRTPRVAQPS